MTQADRVHSTPPTNTSLTRRGALGAIAAATAVTVAGARPTDAAPAVDPIFAAIEKHRAAAAVWDAAVGVRADLPEGPAPMTDEQWEERDRLDDAVDDAREPLVDAGVDLVGTKPTTHAGIIAAISYIRTQMRTDGTYMPYASEVDFDFEYAELYAGGDSRDTMGWIDAFLGTIAKAAGALADPVQS
jgi:hypothetical protein